MGLDLTEVSQASLRALAARLALGPGDQPLAPVDVPATPGLAGLPRAAAVALIQAVLAERACRPPTPQLVWTGPSPVHAAVRDTGVTLRGLFERARERVVLAGYCFDHGKAIFAPLHRVMVQHGVQVDLFLHVPIADEDRPKLTTAEGQEAVVQAALTDFLAKNWPGAPWPTLHYDPRPVTEYVYASLHAKCVVVDEREALVTSANFTQRAQERNVEVGVLLQDPVFARALAAQWHNALSHEIFKTYGG